MSEGKDLSRREFLRLAGLAAGAAGAAGLSACASAAPAAAPTAAPKPAAAPTTAPSAPAAQPTAAPAAAAKIDFPTKAITFVVPWDAGGTTDAGARVLAAAWEKELGKPVTVVNKGGASGQVGLNELAHQKPDGYNLGLANTPAVNTNILDTERQAGFDLNSFDWLMNQVNDPVAAFVRPDSPYKTFQDLIDDAKKRPGELRVPTSGALGPNHLAALLFEEATGTRLRIIHLASGGEQVTQLLGGHVDFTFMTIGTRVARVNNGEFRVLALFEPERNKELGNIPTTVELGFKTLLMTSTRGIVAPIGLPADVREKLVTTLKKSMDSPEHVAGIQKAGFGLKVMSGSEYVNFVKSTHEQVKLLVELAKKRGE